MHHISSVHSAVAMPHHWVDHNRLGKQRDSKQRRDIHLQSVIRVSVLPEWQTPRDLSFELHSELLCQMLQHSQRRPGLLIEHPREHGDHYQRPQQPSIIHFLHDWNYQPCLLGADRTLYIQELPVGIRIFFVHVRREL